MSTPIVEVPTTTTTVPTSLYNTYYTNLAAHQKAKVDALAIVLVLGWIVTVVLAVWGQGLIDQCLFTSGASCSSYSTNNLNLMKLAAVMFWFNLIVTLIYVVWSYHKIKSCPVTKTV